MSEEQSDGLRKFIEEVLEAIATIHAEKERPLTAEIMAHAIIEHLSSPTFWTETMKAELYTLILPTAQDWLNKH
jgi:hypothetical protein